MRKPAKKKPAGKKKLVKKKTVRKAVPKKKVSRKKTSAPKKPVRKKGRAVNTAAVPSAGSDVRSGRQSGDLQGLSRAEEADSESVGELLEEGNAFEAGVVTGVEDAEEEDVKEVRTRQVPEDDVPGEYLDED